MKIEWMGHACFAIETDAGTRIVTDPFDETVGYPMPWGRADIVTTSHGHFDHNHYAPLSPANVADEAKAYVFGDVKITGIASFHDDAQGAKRGRNIMFVIEADGKRVAHLGDLGHMLSEEQVRALGELDAVMIPVGGTYTLTGEQAAVQAKAIGAKATLPMHYSNRWCRFPITNEMPFLLAMNQPYEGMETFVPGSQYVDVILMELKERE